MLFFSMVNAFAFLLGSTLLYIIGNTGEMGFFQRNVDTSERTISAMVLSPDAKLILVSEIIESSGNKRA